MSECQFITPDRYCFEVGDGRVDPTEECDDGNAVNGDGCSSNGTIDANWTCSAAPSVCQKCFNGIVEGTETCDDNNGNNGDGCSSTCAVESGWTCAGNPSVCQKCYNGIVEGTETCDDNNGNNGDGCNSTCGIEAGWTCAGNPSVCQKCYNGIVEGTETCDDGNVNNGDGCNSTCGIEAGWVCTGQPSVCQSCGNGVVDGVEICDDGNVINGDGCNSTCGVEPGWTCAGSLSICQKCGNGIVEGTEACDDGGLLSGDGCSDLCVVEIRPTMGSVEPAYVELGGGLVDIYGTAFMAPHQIVVGELTRNATKEYVDSGRIRVMMPPAGSSGYRSLGLVQGAAEVHTLNDAIFYSPSQCLSEGYYETASGECKECTNGGVCPGGGRIIPMPGYYNSGDMSGYVCRCRVAEACPGGVDVCADGYTGQCFSACAEGYYRSGDYCRSCDSDDAVDTFEIYSMIAVLCLYFAVLLISGTFATDSKLDFTVLMLIQFQFVAEAGSFASDAMPEVAQIFYSHAVIVLMEYEFARPECYAGGYWNFLTLFVGLIIFTVLLFVVFAILLLPVFLLRFVFSKKEL